MKKILSILLISVFLTGIAWAQETIDITPEIRPSVVKITVDTVRILRYTKTCEITLRYLDENGDIVRERTLIYMDVEDDETTEIDETCTDYTDLMIGLDINKQFLKQAIKTKLNLD